MSNWLIAQMLCVALAISGCVARPDDSKGPSALAPRSPRAPFASTPYSGSPIAVPAAFEAETT